jgi:hypothetical protein
MRFVAASMLGLGLGAGALLLTGCDGQYGGTYNCEEGGDGPVKSLELHGGKLTATNLYSDQKTTGTYTVKGREIHSVVGDHKDVSLVDEAGKSLNINGQVCHKK